MSLKYEPASEPLLILNPNPENREREGEIAKLKSALEKLEKEGGSASEGLLKKVPPSSASSITCSPL